MENKLKGGVRGRGVYVENWKMGVGWHHELPHRMSPTLSTPISPICLWHGKGTLLYLLYFDEWRPTHLNLNYWILLFISLANLWCNSSNPSSQCGNSGWWRRLLLIVLLKSSIPQISCAVFHPDCCLPVWIGSSRGPSWLTTSAWRSG